MTIGAQIRTAREDRGLSIDAIAERTRVQPRALAAIELNDASALPPRPFGRGFVRAYAEEVGLDPDRTVRDYFAQFPPTPDVYSLPSGLRTEPEPTFELLSQWAGLASAVAILVLVVTTAVVMGRRNDSAAEGDAVGTTGSISAPSAPSDSRPVASQPAASSAAAPTSPAATTPLNLTFTVTRPCWVAATTDGQRAIYRILDAGEHQTLSATQQIAVRFGDAGAVAWKINGRDGGSLGESGAVRDLTITPENAASIR